MENSKRKFIYKPYGNGDAVVVYFHQRPTPRNDGLENNWDMTGVDIPVKGCMEWSFWRTINNDNGYDEIEPDLTKEEKEEIKKYILEHKELVPNIYK